MEDKRPEVKLKDRFILNSREAAIYFGMGDKALRRMAEDNEGDFCFYHGNKWLFIRTALEDYFLEKARKEPEMMTELEIKE